MNLFHFLMLFGCASILLLLLMILLCFFLVFYLPRRRPGRDAYPIPSGKIYLPYADTMRAWMREADAMPRKTVSISSRDGLTLRGTYYEYTPGSPIELMFHGYRGSARRDLCGGVQRCFALGHSTLIVDQRAAGPATGM